jgi:phage terminase large subunit-like protein
MAFGSAGRCSAREGRGVTLQDDSWFAFIASDDEGNEWMDPEADGRAEPSFGISLKADDLARKAEKAIALPGAQNAFRRMHLNEWTEQAERWIDLAAWAACNAPVDLERLRGRTCFGGLDLSTTTDVTALAWVFPPEQDHGLWYVLSRYFVPEENLRKRAERDRAIPIGWSGAWMFDGRERWSTFGQGRGSNRTRSPRPAEPLTWPLKSQ